MARRPPSCSVSAKMLAYMTAHTFRMQASSAQVGNQRRERDRRERQEGREGGEGETGRERGGRERDRKG